MTSVDPVAFQNYMKSYPFSQLEVRAPTHWLDCQKVRHRYILDAYLQFRPTLKTEEPAVLDLGAYPGALVKTLRLFLAEKGRIDGAGLLLPQTFLEDLEKHQIGYFNCNLDPLISAYEASPASQAPTRLEVEDGTYDTVFATEIIEHTLDPFFLLKEAYRVLKPGGFLVLTTPNQATLSNRLRLLVGKSIYYPLDQSIMYALTDWRPHIREYTLAEMGRILQDAGYRLEKGIFMDLTDDDPRVWGWRHPLLRLSKELSRPFMRLGSFGHNLLFVARKPA